MKRRLNTVHFETMVVPLHHFFAWKRPSRPNTVQPTGPSISSLLTAYRHIYLSHAFKNCWHCARTHRTLTFHMRILHWIMQRPRLEHRPPTIHNSRPVIFLCFSLLLRVFNHFFLLLDVSSLSRSGKIPVWFIHVDYLLFRGLLLFVVSLSLSLSLFNLFMAFSV